jgi:hypothetical protein
MHSMYQRLQYYVCILAYPRSTKYRVRVRSYVSLITAAPQSRQLIPDVRSQPPQLLNKFSLIPQIISCCDATAST